MNVNSQAHKKGKKPEAVCSSRICQDADFQYHILYGPSILPVSKLCVSIMLRKLGMESLGY